MIHSTFSNTSGVYQIINIETEQRYIGFASNIRDRIHNHRIELNKKTHRNSYLQNAWNKYGEHMFQFKVIEFCSKDKMPLLEDFWVKILKTNDRYYGYNLRKTDPKGRSIHSEESILKMKEAKKGVKIPKSIYMKGNLTAMANGHLEYMRECKKKKMKKVINIQTKEVYNSLVELCNAHSIRRATLARKLRGERTNNTPYRYL